MFEDMKIRHLLFTLLIATVGSSLILTIIFRIDLFNEDIFVLFFSYFVLGLFPFVWFLYTFKKQDKFMSDLISFDGFKKEVPQLLLLTVILIFFSLGSFWLLNYILSFPLPNYVEFLLEADEFLPEGFILSVLNVIYISFLGPIIEEFIFRGLLLKRLAKKFSIMTSIFVTNIIFGVLHGDMIGSFIFGFILSLLYLHTQNLLIPIAIHIFNNSIAMALVLFDVPYPRFMSYETISELRAQVWPHLIVLLITLPLIIYYVRKYRYVLTRKSR